MDSEAASKAVLISNSEAWQDLKNHVTEINNTHLRDLLSDEERLKSFIIEHDGVVVDFSRQRATKETLTKLFSLAKEAKLKEKIDKLFAGDHINATENRSVLHVALRAPRDVVITSEGKNVVPDVWNVLDKIKVFSNKIREGSLVGATGKPLTDVVAIGIGGSFLGPLFVHTALKTEPKASELAKGRKLHLQGAVSKHMVAVSTNLKLVKDFGINPENAFTFWDWVGGRYSVCSAVGVLPLSIQYGFDTVNRFLQGAWSVDEHFRTTPFDKNLPVLLGLLSVWNVTFLGFPARAILPYCQALEKLAPHIQQVSMESNGKGVSIEGVQLPYETGEIDFGEPGTNGQHSFYQLIHQGRVIPCDFIGVIESQQPIYLKGEVVSNHDELMSNFFAQADALAYGKTSDELRAEGVPEKLIPHKARYVGFLVKFSIVF
ncbi:hypothetical protein O6H91_23G068600 [Diphasiastrum complanatum]|uniref:Uncharacterized protein n=1 Tax=Diphasiastrum complanatum TaxID=34168 RepID=A0ACC2ABY4_DIPCM|nr:hypothetical protein O6H91_23G068600 [Diphasiastrum complanatum]